MTVKIKCQAPVSHLVRYGLIASLLLITTHAIAETSDWQWQITPWLWGAGMKGDVGAFRGVSALHVDKSFGDILKETRFSGFVEFSGQRDRFIVDTELMYIRTKETLSGNGEKLNLKTNQLIATITPGYRVVDDPSYTLDLLGGVRYWDLNNSLNLHGSKITGRYEEGISWWDGMAGLRGWYAFSEQWSLLTKVDVGSGGSRKTWQLTGALTYQMTPNIAFSTGWKSMSVDYQRDGHTYHTAMRGPLLAVTWVF